MNEKFKILKALWNADYTLKGLIITLLSFLVLLLTGNHLAGFVFFVSGFSIFDILGFSTVADSGISTKLMSYRVIQVMMQFIMLALVVTNAGWMTGIACAVAHWFCTCDKLFYLFQNNQQYDGVYDWLEGWSVYYVLSGNILTGLAKATKNIPTISTWITGLTTKFSKYFIHPKTKELNTTAIIGAVTGIVLCFL